MNNEEKNFTDADSAIFKSSILFCDVIVSGKDSAAGLKYDEENMLAPMIVFLEKDEPAEALVRAAENFGVLVVNNNVLTKNLISYGKPGGIIPEASFKDVSVALARSASPRVPPRKRSSGQGRNSKAVKIPRPLSLELGASIFALFADEPEKQTLLVKPLGDVVKKAMRLLGFAIQPAKIGLASKLKSDEYRILFKGLEAGRGRLELGMFFDTANIASVAKVVASALVGHAAEIMQLRAPELLGRDEVEAILDAAEEKYPVVTGEVKSLLSLGVIREILMSLVSEQVSIRHIAVILETLADWGSFGPVPGEMVIEQIRQSLKRQICNQYADDRQCLRVLTLDPTLEKGFADHAHFRETDNGFFSGKAAESEELWPEDWVNLISSAVRGMAEKGYPPVILCSPKARYLVKEATRRKMPNLAVLAFTEIPSDINVEPVGEIRLAL